MQSRSGGDSLGNKYSSTRQGPRLTLKKVTSISKWVGAPDYSSTGSEAAMMIMVMIMMMIIMMMTESSYLKHWFEHFDNYDYKDVNDYDDNCKNRK